MIALASIADYQVVNQVMVWEEAMRHWAWHHVEENGPVWLFLLLFLSGAGLPLPEDVPLVAAGVSVARGHMSWAVACSVAWVAMMCGDTSLYVLGYIFGYRILHIPVLGRHISEKRLKQCECWFDRWGIWAVALGRMFAGIRTAIVVTAGTMRFNYGKLILADGAAAVVSGGAFLILGYWAGSHLRDIRPLVEHYRNLFSLIALAAAIALIPILRLRARRKADENRKKCEELAAKSAV
ncbi:MAG TPA: DedA family protein [Tepidisphaeraceae bacterium]|nr:DedA family protein [Tepidisphaeraceae bacterium]